MISPTVLRITTKVLKTPTVLMISPTCIMIPLIVLTSPTVLKVSLHSTQDSPPVLNTTHGTAHTYGVVINSSVIIGSRKKRISTKSFSTDIQSNRPFSGHPVVGQPCLIAIYVIRPDSSVKEKRKSRQWKVGEFNFNF